jgi:hypothetical protein
MVYRIDGDNITSLGSMTFGEVDIYEADIEEWAISHPRLLNESLLIVASQYAKFDKTAERPDILALDPGGKLVVVELKRDTADSTTDLQAIKYASYCSTISAEDLQQDYRAFWNNRRDEHNQLKPEDVGDKFSEFINGDVTRGEDGYAKFALDGRPRIMLVSGGFGPEITTPVVWLEREYEMDITCIELNAHQQGNELFVSSRQVLPIPEAEEYMAKRREKDRRQTESIDRAERTINALIHRDMLSKGDDMRFNPENLPENLGETDYPYDPDEDFWRGRITGKTGRSDNIEWLHNGTEHSFTGLTRTILKKITGEERVVVGYRYWIHIEHDLTLTELRRKEAGEIR